MHHPMSYPRAAAIGVVSGLAVIGTLLIMALASESAFGPPNVPAVHAATIGKRDASRAPSLVQAERPPTEQAYLQPGAHVTYAYRDGFNCRDGSYFTDVSAYGWNGRAFARQRWDDSMPGYVWHGRTGTVAFDGVTFSNGTRHPVIVAAWCR